MRIRTLLSLPLFLLFVPAGPAVADGKTVILHLPPASLANWYKPANKRQVWLHTMFRLRRAKQAVELYAGEKEPALLEKWAAKLVKDYRKIPEMVPEWSEEVDLSAAERLLSAVTGGDDKGVSVALEQMGRTCAGCHREYRATATALLRVPAFHEVKVRDGGSGESLSYHEAMERLSRSVNMIKISLSDERYQAAERAVEQFEAGLRDQGRSCIACHEEIVPRKRILGPETSQLLDDLKASVVSRDAKKSGRLLGKIGVNVCARCHAVHRTLAELIAALRPHKHGRH